MVWQSVHELTDGSQARPPPPPGLPLGACVAFRVKSLCHPRRTGGLQRRPRGLDQGRAGPRPPRLPKRLARAFATRGERWRTNGSKSEWLQERLKAQSATATAPEAVVGDVARQGVAACREVRHRSMGPNYIVDAHIQVRPPGAPRPPPPDILSNAHLISDAPSPLTYVLSLTPPPL